jgi:hypothetical protein
MQSRIRISGTIYDLIRKIFQLRKFKGKISKIFPSNH